MILCNLELMIMYTIMILKSNTLNLKTGDMMEQSLQLSKIILIVTMAGLSPPPLQLKQLFLLELEDSSHYLYSNSLIAQHPSETEVAMEDLWKTLSNTLNLIHFKPHPTIHTQVLLEHANTSLLRGLVKFLDFKKFNQIIFLNSKLLSISLQFQLTFNPILKTFNLKLVESLILVDVEQKWTIQSSQLDMELKMDKIISS